MTVRKIIIEKERSDGRGWDVEGDMPYNEVGCTAVAKGNTMMNPLRVAIALGDGSTVYMGLPHNKRRAKLGVAA